MKVVEDGITFPLGFEANGISCGIKREKKLDLALIYSQVPAVTCGLFTSSLFPASHVVLDKERLRKYGLAQAVIINSGNANCAVGEEGLEDAKRITERVAKELKINSHLVLMASTGIIGKRLPVEKIERAIPCLVRNRGRGKSSLASQAIMTTDKVPKQIAVEFSLLGKKIKMGAMAKGAGMINPCLATMLCFITTDLNIKLDLLKKALKKAVDISFNRITIDGEMSPNDTVLIMANGLSGNERINSEGKDFLAFQKALNFVCLYLAREIVLDGEGATKFITIKIKGAKDKVIAEKIARNIAKSPLFKTAMYGENPNWGRIIASCGASEVKFDPKKLEICLGEKVVFERGRPVENRLEDLREILKKREIEIKVNLNSGGDEYFLWTTDLSEEYVRINAGYE